MARIINSQDIPDLLARTGDEGLSREGVLWTYCALDSMVTAEVDEEMDKDATPATEKIRQFEMAQLVPALAMMLRGIRVDTAMKDRLLYRLTKRRDKIEANLDKLAAAVWGRGLNARSPAQLQRFFYEYMNIEPIKINVKGVWKVSTGKEAREKIYNYFFAKPFVNHIQAIIDLGMLIKVLRSGVDADGRMRMSYNVAAANTGRWSSSKNCFGRGTNAQNITPEMREMFIADDGYQLGYADLEQAESRAVAYLAEDVEYIAACESGDLHTAVCKMVWPSVGWLDDIEADKERAESLMFDKLHSYRFVAKTTGHSTNYLISAESSARKNKLPVSTIQDFQRDYFGMFAKIPRWHGSVSVRLIRDSCIDTPLGRHRAFFGKPKDNATLRKAVAFEPQSTVADILNIGLIRVWWELEYKLRLVQVLGQIHDAVLFQAKEEDMPRVVPAMKQLMTIPLVIHGRTMTIPVEIKVGYDWKNMAVFGSDKAKKLKRRDIVEDILAQPIIDS